MLGGAPKRRKVVCFLVIRKLIEGTAIFMEGHHGRPGHPYGTGPVKSFILTGIVIEQSSIPIVFLLPAGPLTYF